MQTTITYNYGFHHNPRVCRVEVVGTVEAILVNPSTGVVLAERDERGNWRSRLDGEILSEVSWGWLDLEDKAEAAYTRLMASA
jgi:hypothetical protein